VLVFSMARFYPRFFAKGCFPGYGRGSVIVTCVNTGVCVCRMSLPSAIKLVCKNTVCLRPRGCILRGLVSRMPHQLRWCTTLYSNNFGLNRREALLQTSVEMDAYTNRWVQRCEYEFICVRVKLYCSSEYHTIRT